MVSMRLAPVSWLLAFAVLGIHAISQKRRAASGVSRHQIKFPHLQQLKLFTVNTDNTNESYALPGSGSLRFLNVGAGQVWQGWRWRMETFAGVAARVAASNPEEIVAFMDGQDIIFGGCRSEDFLRYYEDAVNCGDGARVIFGAQVRLFPYDQENLQGYNSTVLTHRRHCLSNALAPKTDYRPFLDHAQCQHDDAKRHGKCGNNALFDFLNMGFVIGPAGEIEKLFRRILTEPALHGLNKTWNDQMAAARVALANLDAVAFEHTGRMVLNLVHLNSSRFLEVRSDGDSSYVHNTATNTTACFIHGNGDIQEKHQFLSLLDSLEAREATF